MMNTDEIVRIINTLTPSALYYVQQDWFGRRILGKTALMVPINDDQRAIFDELLAVGFIYLDSERGQVGFRTMDNGLLAHQILKAVK